MGGVTIGGVAGLIAAIAFAVLVILLIFPLIKLGQLIDEARLTVRSAGHDIPQISARVMETIDATTEEITKLGVITEDAAKVTANASVVSENAAQMATLFSATLGGPLVKAAAMSYGVRKAIRGNRGPDGKRIKRARNV